MAERPAKLEFRGLDLPFGAALTLRVTLRQNGLHHLGMLLETSLEPLSLRAQLGPKIGAEFRHQVDEVRRRFAVTVTVVDLRLVRDRRARFVATRPCGELAALLDELLLFDAQVQRVDLARASFQVRVESAFGVVERGALVIGCVFARLELGALLLALVDQRSCLSSSSCRRSWSCSSSDRSSVVVASMGRPSFHRENARWGGLCSLPVDEPTSRSNTGVSVDANWRTVPRVLTSEGRGYSR